MARSRIVATAAAVIAAMILVASCDDSTAPAPERGVTLSVATADTTIGGEQYLDITATVTNHTYATLVYSTNCGIQSWFAVRDDNGDQLRMHDPSWGEVCPLEPSLLSPQGVASAVLRFGRSWNEQGAPYRPAPGKYTVYTRFFYFEQGSNVQQRIDQQTTVQWR